MNFGFNLKIVTLLNAHASPADSQLLLAKVLGHPSQQKGWWSKGHAENHSSSLESFAVATTAGMYTEQFHQLMTDTEEVFNFP